MPIVTRWKRSSCAVWPSARWAALAPGTPWAGDAVSALVAALEDPGDEVSFPAIEALFAFGPAARESAPVLVRGLHQARKRRDLLRRGAWLRSWGASLPAGPRRSRRSPSWARSWTRRTSRPACSPSASWGRMARPPRRRSLGWSCCRGSRPCGGMMSWPPSPRPWAGSLPGLPARTRPWAQLLEMLDLEPRSPGIETVIEAVARFGPAAAAALPRLRKLAASGDPAVNEASRRAVAAIEGPGQHTDGAASSPARPRVGHSSSG